MKQFQALLFLAWNLFALLFEKIAGLFVPKPSQKQTFLENYRDDGLWSIQTIQLDELYNLSGCTQCGACDAFIAQHTLANFENTSPQEVILGVSRYLPTIEYTEAVLAEYKDALKDLEALCPARIPFRKLYQLASAARDT